MDNKREAIQLFQEQKDTNLVPGTAPHRFKKTDA